MQETNKVSLATAKCIPAILGGIIIYASYAVFHPLTINYLLHPPTGVPTRLALGIAIPTVHAVLLIPLVASYIRLLLVVFLDPGYTDLRAESIPTDIPFEEPGIEEFYSRDAFVCDENGVPKWCAFCKNFKHDRGHHNQDTGRCTYKMDHFCPWVGGVVGERSYKFFLQFLFYTMAFTTFLLGIFGWAVHHYNERNYIGNHFFAALALAAFFCMFSTGMVVNSMFMVFKNVTTIEYSDKRHLHMAVVLPPWRAPSWKARKAAASESSEGRKIWIGSITYPPQPSPAVPQRQFAILYLKPEINPFNLGAYENFTEVFGTTFWEWILPVKFSPCCDHSSGISEYPLGPEFEQILADAGISTAQPS